MLVRLSLMALTSLGLGLTSDPVLAQEPTPSANEADPLCTFHDDGCDAPPEEWQWQRMEPRVGGFSVELPCDKEQADAFGQLIAMSRAPFEAASTRSCMKAAAAFTATLIGFTALPEDASGDEIDKMLDGAPDLFTAFMRKGVGEPETTFQGRRSVVNLVEKEDRRTKVAMVEAGRFGLIMVTADIRESFDGTKEEGEALMDRFLNSLEIAE